MGDWLGRGAHPTTGLLNWSKFSVAQSGLLSHRNVSYVLPYRLPRL